MQGSRSVYPSANERTAREVYGVKGNSVVRYHFAVFWGVFILVIKSGDVAELLDQQNEMKTTATLSP